MTGSPGASILEFAHSLLASRNPNAGLAFDLAEARGAEPNECAAGRWVTHMLAGDFASAWRDSDSIRRRNARDPRRVWNGEPLDGRRVILRCLHGLGDAVQFLRYAPRLSSMASRLIVEVPPRLLPLAPCFHGIRHVVSWGKYAPVQPVAWDSQIEVTELAYFFRTEIHELPIAQKYLQLPYSDQSRTNHLMGGGDTPRVGLVWAAGEWNPSRSIPFALIRDLLDEPGCEFWNLQGSPAHDEWLSSAPTFQARDIAEIGDGLLNLACVIGGLDLVITVDTLAAHVAGAMGIPAWVLLQYAADWRWMARGCTSPWYPSLRLFRQQSPGNWRDVLQRTRQELQQWIRHPIRTEKIA